MKRKSVLLVVTGLILVIMSASAFGMPILGGETTDPDRLIWTASDLHGRSSQAEFVETSSGFDILLFNLASEVSVPNEVLVGLFFGVNSGTVSNPHVSGENVDSSIHTLTHLNSDGSYNLDGEYAYRNGAEVNASNGNLGEIAIAASSYDPEGILPWEGLGREYLIDENVLYARSESAGGADFGVVHGALNLSSSIRSYVNDVVILSFDYDGILTSDTIGQVNFLYGTDFTQSVPEPATLLLLGCGLLGLGVYRRKIFKR